MTLPVKFWVGLLSLCVLLSQIYAADLITTNLKHDYTVLSAEHIRQSKSVIRSVIYKFDVVEVFEEFEKALKRGVKVYILADDKNNDKPTSFVMRLAALGANVKFWQHDTYTKLHAKMTLCDESTAVFGSANWSSHGGVRGNVELIVTSVDPGNINQLSHIFAYLWYNTGDNLHSTATLDLGNSTLPMTRSAALFDAAAGDQFGDEILLPGLF